MDAIYLDYAANAPLRPEVRAEMARVEERARGNPNSTHCRGREARALLEEARARFAAVIGAAAGEIVFTRGGTEADNLGVVGRALLAPDAPLVGSAIEHRAVLAPLQRLASEGRTVHFLRPEPSGRLDPATVQEHLSERPAVVAVMWVNNETGVIQPVDEIAALCREAGVPFHTDAVQALGKVEVSRDGMAADLMAFSAHKVGGPVGTGALFVRRGTELSPLLYGGGQERGLRPGTQDVVGAWGAAVAAELAAAEREEETARLAELRGRLEEGLRRRIPELVVNGGQSERVATTLNVSIPGADPESLLMGLDLEGVCASSGSACSSGGVSPSHVLTAMGLPEELATPSLRLSLGRETTADEIDRVLEALPAVVHRVRELAATI